MGHHNPTAMLSQTMHSYLMVGQSAGAQRNKVWLLPPVISKMETHWRHWHQHFPVTASTASAPSHPVRSAGASRLIMLCAVITGTRQCQGHNYWHQAVPGPQLLAPGHNYWHQATITGTRPQLLAPGHNYWHQATITGTRLQLLAPEHNPDLKQW